MTGQAAETGRAVATKTPMLPSLPQWVNSSMACLMEVDGKPALPERLTLSETERAFIASQVESLRERMRPASEREILEEFTRLMADHAQQPMSQATAKARAIGFVETLSDLPAWAIQGAAKRWRGGEGEGNHSFAPNAAQIRPLAEMETLPTRTMIEKLRRLLVAVPLKHQPPMDRAKLATKFGDLASKLEGKIRDEKTRTAQYQDETSRKTPA
jgi:hypothetical protein